jgi:hypothetical protein
VCSILSPFECGPVIQRGRGLANDLAVRLLLSRATHLSVQQPCLLDLPSEFYPTLSDIRVTSVP